MPVISVRAQSARLSAPMSRRESTVLRYLSAPCQCCGAKVAGFGWRQVEGVGVLMHDTATGHPTPCPAARPFDWATGETITASVAAVAA